MTVPPRVQLAPWPVADVSARLRECDVLVCTASLLGGEEEVSRALGCLSRQERDRFLGYGNPVVARRFALGRALLRAVVAAVTGSVPAEVELQTGVHGKPTLRGPSITAGLWFSLSHCDDLAVLAVSRKADVGIDVERTRSMEQWERVADRVLDPQERAALKAEVEAGADAGTAFLGAWCRVEAELKAIGCGIAGLEAHRAGRRPAGLQVVSLQALPIPVGLRASRAEYQAAVALCSPASASVLQSAPATSHAIEPVATPASASTA
jgi:4'-phosphopantetheinyl transferase